MSKVVCIFCRGEVIDGECECNQRYLNLLKSIIEDFGELDSEDEFEE